MLQGLPTRHYRYRTSYSMKLKILGMGRESAVVAEQDFRSTDSLTDVALGVWLRADDRRTGDQQFDKLISAEMTKVKGFPLKTVTRTTMTSKKGKAQVSISTTEVTDLLRDVSIPEPTFVLPASYVERPFLPGMPPPDE